MNRFYEKTRGFTLIELVLVAAIVGLLVSCPVDVSGHDLLDLSGRAWSLW